MVIIFGASLLLDGLLHLTPLLWRWRKPAAAAAILLSVVGGIGVAVSWPNALSVLIAMAGLYRAFNALRIIKERMHLSYLRRTTRTTAMVMIGWQLGIAAIWWAWYQTPTNRQTVWLVVAVTQCLVAITLFMATIRQLKHARPALVEQRYADTHLPSVSVAIPARNETDDLRDCLQSVLASDYPKLEVLVLDDCSQNKRTPEIIRSFAHEGVRFLQGEDPRPTWLAKNQAYDQLAREANGEIILFCGVDVRLQPYSIRSIVSNMLEKQKAMVSILPHRQTVPLMRRSFAQILRYWWELVPPRRLFNRPPVLSSCWAVQRKALLQLGGFAAVTRSIVPEAYFAKALIGDDRYSFMLSDEGLGVESNKQLSDQVHTAVRTRYPQLHRRPEQVFAVTLAEMLLIAMPFVTVAAGWWLPITGLTHMLGACAAILLIVVYQLVIRATRAASAVSGLLSLPFIMLADTALVHYSMVQYEFSTVQWKGRNVCIPVMHVVPRLPKI